MSIELAKNQINLSGLNFSETRIVSSINTIHISKNQINQERNSFQAIIIDINNEAEARKLIEMAYKKIKLILVQGRDASFNRKILENKKVNILLNPEKYGKADKLYERDSGLNHILCKIAKENSIAILLDVKELIQRKGKEKAIYLSRVMQNIKLCKKYNVPYLLTLLPETLEEARDRYDLKAFARVLGMDTKMAEQSVEKTWLAGRETPTS